MRKGKMRHFAIQKYYRIMFRMMIFLFFFIFFIRFFVFSIAVVDGLSMYPLLSSGDVVFIGKYNFLIKEPQRFDVVQILNVENNGLILKRVVGLPGEEVLIKRGNLYIVNELSKEPILIDESDYVEAGVNFKDFNKEYTLGSNEYFVLGDNRDFSTDSREFGSVHRSMILGVLYHK